MSMLSNILSGGVKHEFSSGALRRSFFVARNATTGTGLASADAATARSATANLMTVFNSDTTANRAVIIPVRLMLRCTAVNTSASQLNLAIFQDDTNRFTSGGVTLSNISTSDSGVSGYSEATSSATINFGVLVTAAASDENRLWDREIHTTILAADDTFDIWFGDGPFAFPSTGNTGSHETAMQIVPPVWIEPGSTMIIDTFGASQAADPAWEPEFWWIEHPNNN